MFWMRNEIFFLNYALLSKGLLIKHTKGNNLNNSEDNDIFIFGRNCKIIVIRNWLGEDPDKSINLFTNFFHFISMSISMICHTEHRFPSRS